MLPLVTPPPPHPVYGGQQVRILGENYTLEDEEDSKIGQVSWYCMLLRGLLAGVILVGVIKPSGKFQDRSAGTFAREVTTVAVTNRVVSVYKSQYLEGLGYESSQYLLFVGSS